MISTPLWIQLIHSFFTGFLSAYMGLLLVNIRPNLRKLLLTGLFYDLGLLIIWSFNLSIQIRFLILTAFLLLIINIIWRLGLFRSIVITILGTLLLALGESIFLPISLNVLDPSIKQGMWKNITILFMPLPQIILSILVIFVCIKSKFHLFDFSRFLYDRTSSLTGKRFNLVMTLVITMTTLIIFQVACNVTVFAVDKYNSLSWELVGYLSNVIIIMICFSAALMVIQLIELTEKESQYIIQTSYVETIEELYTAIRGQRHDLINHLQVLYGFLQMGNIKEVQKYLETMIGDSVSSNNLVDTGSPGLSALLYIKSGIALTNGISLNISVDKQINDIAIPSYELNRIVGNIINNAFDYVMKLDEEKRAVDMIISEAESYYLFEISNYGHIDEEVKQKLFKKGFSTKDGEHAGLGLFIVKNMMEKYKGIIEVASKDSKVIFSLYIAKKETEGSNIALHRRETGGDAGKPLRWPL